MLDPREVAHCKGNLQVDGPDDASEHGGSDSGHVSGLSLIPECLGIEYVDVEEVNNKRRVETIRHPAKDSVPIKEQVFRPLLVQGWEL